MDTLGGMTRTGVKVTGPASDLVELEDAKGLKHTGITFHRKYRDHACLTSDLVQIAPFLERPDVCDLLELVERVPEQGAFIYPTGSVFPLADAFDVLSKMGEIGGVRAGLELCFRVAQVLQDAYTKADRFRIYHHGDLSPWRLVLKSDGQVRVIGFGLPQVEMIVAREADRTQLKEDSYRYCPPERIEGEEEDFSSDLYSLALMGFELMTGEPLFNGGLSDIKQQATNAQGPYRLYQHRDRLPESVVELLSRCLKFDIDARHADINEFIWEVRDVLALPEIDGPTLAEVAARAAARIKRKRASAGHGSESDDDLAGAAVRRVAPAPEAEAESEAEQAQRWGRVSRSGGREVRKSGSPAEPAPRDPVRDRLQRSGGTAAPDPKAALRDQVRRSGGAPAADDPKAALRDRLRGSSGPTADDPKAALRDRLRSGSSPPADDPKAALRDRLRRSGGSAPAGPDDPKEALRDRLRRSSGSAPAAPPAAPEDPKAALRDRLRRSAGSSAAAPAKAPAISEDPRSSLRDRLRRSGGRSPDAKTDARDTLGSGPPRQAEPIGSAPPEPAAGRSGDAPAPARSGRAASLLSRLRSSRADEPSAGDGPPAASDAPASPSAGAASAATYRVAIDGLGERQVAIDPATPIAVLAARALEAFGGPRVGFDGVVEGWFSVEQGDHAPYSSAPCSELDASAPVRMRFVAAKAVPCAFQVDGQRAAKLRADVSTALTAGAILEHALAGLELSGQDWHLSVAGERLHPLQPLGEVVTKGDLTVVVSK
jgi:hypothetical protein